MIHTPDYLLIGHLTADLTPNGRSLGGTVSFAARTAHAFGFHTGILTSAASDEPFIEQLAPYAEVRSIPAAHTSTFENIYDERGKRVQYVRGVASKLHAGHVPPEWHAAPLVHLAPLTDEVDPQIARLFSGSTVLLTLQGWLRRWDQDGRVHFKRWFDPEVLRHIDMVVFSEEDIAPAPELEALFAHAVPHLFVTRAERGGTYYHRGQPIPWDTPQVPVVDATGAGDVFAAAVLAGQHLLDSNLEAATRVAAVLGANAVTRRGIDGTPTPAEVEKALAAVRQNA